MNIILILRPCIIYKKLYMSTHAIASYIIRSYNRYHLEWLATYNHYCISRVCPSNTEMTISVLRYCAP